MNRSGFESVWFLPTACGETLSGSFSQSESVYFLEKMEEG